MTSVSAPPKLRSDLTVSRQQTADGPVCVVKDPVSGSFFRFRETEQFIAEQLDGATPIDVVRRRTEERFGATLPAERLAAFLTTLEKHRLLETGKPRGATRRGRIRGSALYLRLALFDPDRLLDRLVRRVRGCFTPQFLALSAALTALAVGTTLANWSAFTQDASRLFRVSAIPLFLAVTFVVASAHEFAHGLTCKRFGGRVHEMGFMLIYFQPALYCNVSDAWLFPERRKRLWVGLAGPWFELFLWGLAVLVWRLSDAETWVNYVALMVMTVSGAWTLLNFNPFLKLDGYYLLSDYLDMPNLRRRSFAYVGDRIKRLVGWGSARVADVSPRERRVYLTYGLVATVCSLSLLAYVFVKAGGLFIEAGQPAALALLTALVGVRSRRRFRGLFTAAPDVAAPAVEGGPPPPVEPKPQRKRRRATRRRMAWLAVAAAAWALGFLGRMQLRIGGTFTVLPAENADVRAEVEGIIEAIVVNEGDAVRAGDVIARLSNHALLAELHKTGPAIREARAFVRKLEAGPTAEEVAVVRAAVSKTEDRLRFAQHNVERLRTLFASAAVTRQELDAAQEVATTVENDLAEAQRRLDLLQRRSRPEDIDASRARLALLETQRRFLAGEVRELTVASPVAGIVATPSRQLKELEGQLVGRGALIAKIYDFTTVMAQIAVSEREIGDISVGQPVVLRVRAHPHTTFHGRVTAIATAAEGTPAATAAAAAAPSGGAIPGKTFTVTTRIDNRALLLKPGMTGHAKVLGGRRRIVDLITRRIARSLKVEVWSWW